MTKLEQILLVAMQMLALMIVVSVILALGWALLGVTLNILTGV